MNIMEMAKESGIQEWWGEPDEFYDEFCEMLERFAALVRAEALAEPVKQEPVGWVMTNGVFTEDSFKAKMDSDALPVYREPVDAKAIRAEALEEAAKVCDEHARGFDEETDNARLWCAAAIRGLK